MDENVVTGVVRGEDVGVGSTEGEGKLVEAAVGKWEFRVEVERGGGKSAEGVGKLGREEKLEAELGFAAAALGDELSY